MKHTTIRTTVARMLGFVILAAIVGGALGTTPAHAACPVNDPDCIPGGGGGGYDPPECTSPYQTGPLYRVKAIRFFASDESHWDGAGSDEPYWVFSSVGPFGTNDTRKTSVFGSVDSGEYRNFGVYDYLWGNSCYGRPAPNGIGFSVQLWEHDSGDTAAIRSKTKYWFDKAGSITQYTPLPAWVSTAVNYTGEAVDQILEWANDDAIGSQTFAIPPSELSSRLPSVGSAFDITKWFGGAETAGGADYYLTIRVSRVG